MARGIDARDADAVRHVAERLRREAIDIVHGHGAKGGAYARIAGTLARREGGPARIYTPHGGSLHFAPRSAQGVLYHTLERVLARMSEAVIFESRFAANGFKSTLGLSQTHWPVIHNGVAEAEFEPVLLEPDAADVLYLGELRMLKGVDVLLDALADLPAVRATLVGGGPDADRFHAAARPLGPRIAFLPPMPAREAFAKGRVVVVPSRAESLPYVVLEAAAAGKPVIATRVGGIPEIFSDLASDLVPPGDPVALARVISGALADSNATNTAANALTTRIRTVFSADRMVEDTVAVYRSKLNTHFSEALKRSTSFSK
jgi:glycosyltransferase involved in cell wall biosynthesis